MSENYKIKDESFFYKYSRENGYQQEGFEALSFDCLFNGLLATEFSKLDENGKNCIETMNAILKCKFILNDEKKLELILDPCDYIVVQSNGGGDNRAQESLIFVNWYSI